MYFCYSVDFLLKGIKLMHLILELAEEILLLYDCFELSHFIQGLTLFFAPSSALTVFLFLTRHYAGWIKG